MPSLASKLAAVWHTSLHFVVSVLSPLNRSRRENVGQYNQRALTRHHLRNEAFLQVSYIFVPQRASQLEIDSSDSKYVAPGGQYIRRGEAAKLTLYDMNRTASPQN